MADHRDIGRELDLFHFSDYSPGSPIWLPAGNTVYSILQEKIRRLQDKNGYVEVRTPVLFDSKLYVESGHWEHYAKNMFKIPRSEPGDSQVQVLALKPMNCPGHMLVFQSKTRSIRDLPLRIAEQGILHRDESSGSLGGLIRCRCFCQDDAHIFCTEDQIKSEIFLLSKMVDAVYSKFGMKLRVTIGTRPEDCLGETETWNNAEQALKDALTEHGTKFQEAKGEGAFYGPKIDFYATDNLGREWQTATIQLDFQLPSRFDLTYRNHKNELSRPVVIHRAVYGSFERFIGILLEHFGGDLPCWLTPIQWLILPVTTHINPYAQEIDSRLKNAGLRSEIDLSNNRLPHKIALAQERRVPYMIVVGDREVNDGTITYRDRSGKNTTKKLEEFMSFAENLNRFDF